MAGATQHRSRGFIIKTPPATIDDGTLADAPLADTPVDGDDLEQHGQLRHSGSSQHSGSAHGEIAPLGANVINALRIVSKLEQLGLDKQEISLPKCIVLGQQSTDKSSVIEALSGIKTPRDTGTCTRCPLFIELQPSADPRGVWHADIYLLRQYDVATDTRQRGMDTEFTGWVPAAVPAKIPFAQTDNPAHLEHLIHCAQRATLSPLENPDSFLDPSFDDSDIHRTLFSPNIVCITVSKPGLPPLSFFDLPGLIGQAENDDEASILPLVEKLVTKYIMDPEALILVTCALKTDVANSIAAGLVKKRNVTDRCMGVLTKPDRLRVGESPKDLANIFEGRRFSMGHGYFVVKNLNSEEIKQGLTLQDARRLENEFFTTVAPWSTHLRPYQARFGTLNMQQYLSSQLGNRVLLKLPAIYHQIEERLATVNEGLSRTLETPVYTAVRTVADVLEAFSNQISSEMAGDHGHVLWNNTWKEIQQTFWNDLLTLKPTMLVGGDLDSGVFYATLAGGSADESIVIDSDGDDQEIANAPETPSKKRKHDSHTKREPQTPAPCSSLSKTPQKPSGRPTRVPPPSTSTSDRSHNFARLKKQLKLDEVALQIRQSAGSDVPGQIDRKMRDEMILSTFEHWPLVIKEFFNKFEKQLKTRMRNIFDIHFRHWKGSELHSASLMIFESVLDANLHEQRGTMAVESFNDERKKLHVFHKDILDFEKANWMEKCESKRLEARLKMYGKEAYGRALSSVEEAKLKKDERRMVILRKEPYRVEINLVADMVAHYMIAARRIHDKIIMRIESKFFEQLHEKLRDELQDQLGIYDGPNGPHNAQRLLAESPERLERRITLVAKKKALLEGLQCFKEHNQKFQA
ncbi:hypothetical protein BU25DRAFT_427385 [Macroventuria anomochaeta]|uniref:Uncharacterized protein n=1 Tax=Macroventuria anomochaeta TaxID=301207 RepID=A0ACB6SKJ6_9PLEO|nr:uncharacterized protein BU25DRAFT_427385 [Macroventuria anomochaeta]KAF2633997.1 hypothetical protein BU25DRAFT_427385 [Macroventuria anomochaeta]